MDEFCDLPVRVKEKLERAGVNISISVLQLSSFELRRLANLTEDECDVLKRNISKYYVANRFYSVYEAQHSFGRRWEFLSTGCKILDNFLSGGYSLKGITEIAGESSSGKTQFCLQAALSVQMPRSAGGLDAGAVYICTEDRFPSPRLQQLLKVQANKFQSQESISKLGDNIFIEHIPDSDSLKKCVLVQLPLLMKQRQIGLVVIDSIAGAYRSDYDASEGAIKRAQELRKIATFLHLLAREHHLAVICVNQVTAVPGHGSSVPALGLAWANLVTNRLQLYRTSHKRVLELVFSPHLPRSRIQFAVTENGVEGVTQLTL